VTAATDRRPTWFVSPEQQLERAYQLWPDRALLDPPTDFRPETDTEVLLLHVPDTLDSLWDKVRAPEGCKKYRSDDIKSDNLRLAPNIVERTEPVWVIFDPEHGRGIKPKELWGNPNLASSEIFSALIQFLDWASSWRNGASAPNLAGYQLKFDTNWSFVPYFALSRQLVLDYMWGGDFGDTWASPSVREC
jgi:hypothetical protein